MRAKLIQDAFTLAGKAVTEFANDPAAARQILKADSVNPTRMELAGLMEDYETLTTLFWASVREQFPESRGANIGLREGWKVVKISESDVEGGDFGMPGVSIQVIPVN